jgi:hypothetical protein
MLSQGSANTGDTDNATNEGRALRATTSRNRSVQQSVLPPIPLETSCSTNGMLCYKDIFGFS